MKEIILKYKFAVVFTLALIVLISASVACSQSKSHSSAGEQEKIAALKDLRDTGVISAQEYEAKVQVLEASAPPAQAAKVSWSGTRKEEVVDPAYGMTAFTIDVPAGWKFAGMILRPGGCHPPPYPAAGLSYTALSPDGTTAVVGLPGVSWSWSSNGTNIMGPKCPSTMNIDTAAGLLLNIAVPNLHPDAKKVTLMPLPQKAQDAIAAQNEKLAASARGYGLRGSRNYTDAARVRVEYESNGRQMEEMEFVVIDCLESPVAAMPIGGGQSRPGYTKRTCSSRGTSVRRAPKGQLDELLEHATPPQINPEWDQRVIRDMTTRFQQMQAASDRQFQQNMANFKAQGEARLAAGKAFQQSLRLSTDRALAADRAQQAAMDASAHATVLHSLDQQEFRNPATGQIVQASSQYNHQWMSSDGSTLIQTNDHTLDPNGSVYPVSQSWTELVPK
jgi:hypothetical protein